MDSEQLQEMPIVEVKFKEARLLADCGSINQDLTFCIEACTRLLEMERTKSDDELVKRSLWSSSLVSYVRCFAFGKRLGLNAEDVFGNLKGEPIAAHQWYKDMRDKHLAHSVNPYEQMKVGLVLSPPESEVTQIVGVQTSAISFVYADEVGIEQLLQLASIARRFVGIKAKELEVEVIDVGKGMSIEQLKRKARPRLHGGDPKDARQARKSDGD